MISYSQNNFVVQNKQKSDKIRFSLINNLIIVPIEVNGAKLSFLLDTGVSKPMIFSFLNISDSLEVKNPETIFLRGFGSEEYVEALKSDNNILKIGDAVKMQQDLYIIFNDELNFGPKLGVPVHGIIGFDIFKDLVVEINYSKKYLRLTETDAFKHKKCRKCEVFNLEFHNGKPYIKGRINNGERDIVVKLLIDTGSSDALWLFENDSLGISPGDTFFQDFLGYGLSGSVYGKRSEIESFSLKHFELNKVNVAYPDPESITIAKQNKDRNGSLAGNILKRFNIILDYNNGIITLKKNANFNDKFSYNRSGIELVHEGVRVVKEIDNSISSNRNVLGINAVDDENTVILDAHYKIALKPSYTIAELRKDSPAERAGLMIGDVILTVNGKQTHNFSLQDITHMFYDDIGKPIKLKVDRDGMVLNYEFELEDVFK
ncbi:PDZ domain-containing protein [Marixanthotalea marina]|uniref:PDZ domain-containing protein n=1 Tax=Marixanthotalea marina TaxID=2844359 RepID=UPI002989F20E|nr:PDZ domain-containing protein [Marixanthotalea marina]